MRRRVSVDGFIISDRRVGKKYLSKDLSMKEASKPSNYLEKNSPEERSLFMNESLRQGHVSSHVQLAYINEGGKCRHD